MERKRRLMRSPATAQPPPSRIPPWGANVPPVDTAVWSWYRRAEGASAAAAEATRLIASGDAGGTPPCTGTNALPDPLAADHQLRARTLALQAHQRPLEPIEQRGQPPPRRRRPPPR